MRGDLGGLSMVTTPNVTIRNINVQADISMHLNRSTCFIILRRVHRLLDIKRDPSFNEGNSVQSTSKYILINADIAGGIHLRPPYSSVFLFASKRRHSVCRNKFKEKSCTPMTESLRLKNAACSPGMQKACMYARKYGPCRVFLSTTATLTNVVNQF